MNSKRICVAIPEELVEALDGIAKKEKKTRSALLKEAVEQYAEGFKFREARRFLREWTEEEVVLWLKQDKNSEKIVRAIKAKRAG